MQVCYADPPYIGQAKKHYSDDPKCAEVDHAELIDFLMAKYECWALSCSSTTLIEISRLKNKMGFYVLPADARIAAWVKPFAVYKPNVNPAYAWEPIILYGGRSRGREKLTLPDWVSANITLKKGVHGAKPEKFCYWLFDVLGMEPEDEFIDMYPGSGSVTAAWKRWKRQMVLI